MLWTYNQHNFAGGRLDKELMGRQDLTQYHKGASELRNFTIRRQGNLAKRRGTNLACDLSGLSISKYRLIPLVYDRTEGFYILLTGGYAYLCNRNGVRDINGNFVKSVTTADAYRISSGISDARVGDIDFVQSGDTVLIVHHEIKPMKIEFFRNEVSHTVDGAKVVDHEALTLVRSDLSFSAQAHTPPQVKSVTPSPPLNTPDTQQVHWGHGASTTVRYAVTYVGSDGSESYPSTSMKFTYKAPWNEGCKATLSIGRGTNATNPTAYNVYKDNGGGYGLIGVIREGIGTDGTCTFDDDYINPDLSTTPPDKASQKTFSKAGEYPSVVSLYQQRLVLGCTDKEPFTFWMSCVGDLYNFSTHSSIREDDSITATLAATEQPEINHALLSKELMLFANSGEWEIAPVTGNTLSYRTISAKMQSAIGAARWTKPIIVGDEIIFVDATGERMLATRYNYASDGYESIELTVLSQWMFRNNMIRRMAYRTSPDSTIHCAMDDGALNIMVYMKEHEVCAWSRHDLGGGYLLRDVACSKATVRGSTDIMYLVQNPSTKKYELWSERDDVPIRTTNAIADFVCMDRCQSVEAHSADVPAGMLAVGKVTARVFRPDDEIEEDAILGYPFESKFESIYPDAKGGDESIQMQILNPTEAHVRTIDSSSFSIGAASISTAYDRKVTMTPIGSGGNIDLPDSDQRMVFTGVNTRDARIRIRHSEPFTLNILSIGVTYQVEPENQNGGN